MSVVYGVNRTKIIAMEPANLLAPEVAGANVKWVYDEYEASSLAQGSTINVCENIPLGARIVDWIIDSDALGTGVTLDLGTADDADEFASGIVCTGAVKANHVSAGIDSSLGFEVDTVKAGKITLTTGVGSATGTIKVGICYTAKE